MKIPNTFLVFSFALLGGGMICFGVPNAKGQNSPSTRGQTQNGRGGPMSGRYKGLETAASHANGFDSASITALVEEVFKVPRFSGNLPEVLETRVKGRLVQAEISHRQNGQPRISEGSIVTVVNKLAERFSAPDYAKTNASQVRFLRMRMALTQPTFMGTEMTRADARIGDSINPTMSPAQAAHLIATLIDQKLSNPIYQVTPAEWDPRKITLPVAKRGESPLGVLVNPKRDEMHRALSAPISVMNLSQASDLVDDVLANLGI